MSRIQHLLEIGEELAVRIGERLIAEARRGELGSPLARGSSGDMTKLGDRIGGEEDLLQRIRFNMIAAGDTELLRIIQEASRRKRHER